MYVAADWSNMEGRITAYASKDPVLTKELEDELHGGPKVHSLNAALIYGIDPSQAKTTLIDLKGQKRPAYDGGKRLTHAFNYGMGPYQMAETFWVSRQFAQDAIRKLSIKYAGVVAWRRTIADKVFGEVSYNCSKCDYTQPVPGACVVCSTKRVKVPLRRHTIEWGEGLLRTPFGRIRHYPGPREKAENAVASQIGQGGGASIWYSVLDMLHSPTIPGPDRLIWNPAIHSYGVLLNNDSPTRIIGGTYDSFLGETMEDTGRVLDWLLWCMERPWPQLGGLRLPAEGSSGKNWGKQSTANPDGLRDIKRVPFSGGNPYAD